MAKSIVEAIGPHSAYWEPFCGSMAVLMAKPVAPAETVNDLHNDLINLAWTVQHEKLGPSLYRHLRRVLAHQSELERARLDLAGSFIATPGAPDLGRAADYFIASWLGISGLSGTKAAEDKRRGIARRFTSNGGSPSVRFAGAVESIPHWRRRMRRVFVLQTCGLEICEKVEDKDGTVIYVDPPYVEKSIEYIHDFKPADHERLAKALARFEKTRVVVSYYEHAWLKELYPPHRWESIDCTMRKAMNNPNKATERRSAPEVLLVNSRKSATLFR
jgi:DNA adenine methylase